MKHGSLHLSADFSGEHLFFHSMENFQIDNCPFYAILRTNKNSMNLQASPTTITPPPLSDTYSPEENQAMQRAVIVLFERWGLTDAQAGTLLGGISAKTFSRWRKGEYGRLTLDQSDRLSHLLGIHKALRIIFQDPERFYGWVTRENDAFGGKTALEVMLGGHMRDLERVRLYLDSVRGGW